MRDTLAINPRDGLRQRFAAVIKDPQNPRAIRRLKVELDRDGFAAGENIVTDKALGKIVFTLENRTADAHSAGLWLSPPDGVSYAVTQDGRKLAFEPTSNGDYPWRAPLQFAAEQKAARIEITRLMPR